MATVKIPGIGPVEKKWVYVGVALVAGIAGYAYWARAQADATEFTDYTTTEPEPDYAHDGGASDYVNPGGSQGPVEQDFIQSPTTNAEWTQVAVSTLYEAGYESLAVVTALGKYLARMSLSVTQAEIVRAAVAMVGPPPVGEYPIQTSPTPDPDPEPQQPAGKEGKDLPAPKNLKVVTNRLNDVSISWDPVPGATGYRLYRTTAHSNIGHSTGPKISIWGLRTNSKYTFYVTAMGIGPTESPKSKNLTLKTVKG